MDSKAFASLACLPALRLVVYNVLGVSPRVRVSSCLLLTGRVRISPYLTYCWAMTFRLFLLPLIAESHVIQVLAAKLSVHYLFVLSFILKRLLYVFHVALRVWIEVLVSRVVWPQVYYYHVLFVPKVESLRHVFYDRLLEYKTALCDRPTVVSKVVNLSSLAGFEDLLL